MPADFNENRAEYFPAPDFGASYYFIRVREVLEKWTARDIVDVNDAIDAYECKMIAEGLR